MIAETVFLRLFGVLVLVPQVAVVLVAYVGIRRSFALGAVATLVFAAVADLCWGGPRGYYALGLTAAFFTATVIKISMAEEFFGLATIVAGVMVGRPHGVL